MSKYVSEIRVEVEFDGDKHVWVLKPLKYEDTLLLRGGDGNAAMLRYAGFVPNYLVKHTPVRDVDGNDVPLEDVLSRTYFAPLVGLVMKEHVKAARPPDPTLPVDQSEG